jgi:hypothetical protein
LLSVGWAGGSRVKGQDSERYPWTAESAAAVGKYLAVRADFGPTGTAETIDPLATRVGAVSVAPFGIQASSLQSYIPSTAMGFYGGEKLDTWHELAEKHRRNLSRLNMRNWRQQEFIDMFPIRTRLEIPYLTTDTLSQQVNKQQHLLAVSDYQGLVPHNASFTRPSLAIDVADMLMNRLDRNMDIERAWQWRLLNARAKVGYDVGKVVVSLHPGGSLYVGVIEAARPGLPQEEQAKHITWGFIGESPSGGLQLISTGKNVWDLMNALPKDLQNLERAHGPLTLEGNFTDLHDDTITRSFTQGVITKTFVPGRSAYDYKIITERSYRQSITPSATAMRGYRVAANDNIAVVGQHRPTVPNFGVNNVGFDKPLYTHPMSLTASGSINLSSIDTSPFSRGIGGTSSIAASTDSFRVMDDSAFANFYLSRATSRQEYISSSLDLFEAGYQPTDDTWRQWSQVKPGLGELSSLGTGLGTLDLTGYGTSGLSGYGTSGLSGYGTSGLLGYGTSGLLGYGTSDLLEYGGISGLSGYGTSSLLGYGGISGLSGYGTLSLSGTSTLSSYGTTRIDMSSLVDTSLSERSLGTFHDLEIIYRQQQLYDTRRLLYGY